MAAHRLERIVQDLLDLARLESQAVSLDSRVFATERVFAHVINRHELEARQHRVRLLTQCEPSADQMVGDPDRIEQVLDNLVANALRYTPPGGTIELQAFAEGRDVRSGS